jgi:cytidine deaminase
MAISHEDLINAALDARNNAYARYSGFAVGAAIVDDRGRLHVGCNIENAAYPLGSCAEASAIAAMVEEGTIAVAGGAGEIGPCTPCGGCRQRIAEFANADTEILAIDDSGEWQTYSIDDLLPASFHLP